MEKQRAVIYDITSPGVKSDVKSLVEDKFGLIVIKEYYENKGLISKSVFKPALSDLISDIWTKRIRVNAVVVKSLTLLGNLDVILFVKKILEERGVRLITLKSREKALAEIPLKNLEKKLYYDKLRDWIMMSFLGALGTYIIVSTFNPYYIALILATFSMMFYIYIKRVSRSREYLRKKIRELISLKIPYSSKVRLRVGMRGIEVLKEE